MIMENTTGRTSSRGRKRYNCCYCNVYFHQTDSWQRHNRKHTGVEIECDDCGQMCSDFFELKSHQRLCEAYRVYSEEHFTEISDSKDSKKEQEPPDSTSNKQEHSERGDRNLSPWPESRDHEEEDSPSVSTNDEVTKNNTSELDDLIGEDTNNSIENTQSTQEENEDLETEAMIGVDESVPHLKNDLLPDNESKTAPTSTSIVESSNIGVDSQIVIKVESALNDAKRGVQQQKLPLIEKEDRPTDMSSFLPRPPPLTDAVQTVPIDNAEMNKKYQPYFCKNCGARFTRKDSVTRHLKKGTCSGKSAIVCSICGKVFPELYELQQHFKLDHKNVILAPSTVIPHRTILPKPNELPESARSQHFTTFPPGTAVPFVIREQPLPHSSRPNDSQYRTMPHNMQGVFYPPNNNRTSYTRQPRVVYSSSNHGGHHNRDHYSTSRQYDQKYSSSSLIRKESPYGEKGNHNRKRDYPEYHHRERYTPEPSDPYISKRNKLEYEGPEKSSPHLKGENNKNQINLSEYTNNAMNSQQYFSKRFVQKDGVGHHDPEPPNQVHQCKICGNEFPRYEYLLTHLRKHKEKLEHDEDNLNGTDSEKLGVDMNNESGSPDNQNQGIANRHNFESLKNNFVESHEGIPIVHQQPPQAPSSHRTNEGVKIVHPPPPQPPPGVEPIPVYTIPIQPPTALQTGVVSENTIDAITPGVDGKFRPFICENCGQRFTRKDSLVRHAKKQTCYEEQIDLKCKHCDKTFRYHKCLTQHQELVHGISREEQSKSKPVKTSDDEDTDSDRSDKNESFPDNENPQSSTTPSTETTPSKTLKYRSPNAMAEVKPFKQQSSSTFYPPSQQPPPRALSFIPTNPYTKIEIPSNPYNKIDGPGNEAPKFIPPRIDDKVKIAGELSNGSSSASSGNQDTQYIGYCTVARPFQCEYCGDRFAHRHSLKRHIRRHLGIGIPCVECGKLYRDQSEWRRHQKSIHNRHYEKYEVPSRISYRDGMENGMIGMVPSNEFDNNDGSDSDKSGDEEITMVKPSTRFQQHNSSFGNHSSMAEELQKAQSEITQHLKDASYENSRINEKDLSEETKPPKQAFNFKSYSSGDKDSRKSALDRYLQSTHSDEEEDHSERETTTVFVEPKNEFVEANNNNNNNNNTLDEKSKFGYHHNESIGEMVTVGMSSD